MRLFSSGHSRASRLDVRPAPCQDKWLSSRQYVNDMTLFYHLKISQNSAWCPKQQWVRLIWTIHLWKHPHEEQDHLWEFGPNVARRRLWIGLWVMMSAKTQIQTWMQKERSPYVPALWWVCPEHCLAFCNNACWDFSIVAQRRKKGLLKISIWTKNGTDSATNVHTLWKWPATCYTATWTVLLTLFISSDAWCPSDSLHNTMLIFPDSLYIFTHSVFQLEINAVCSIQSFFLLIISSEEVTQSIIHVGCWINMCQCLYAQVAAGWLFFFFLAGLNAIYIIDYSMLELHRYKVKLIPHYAFVFLHKCFNQKNK